MKNRVVDALARRSILLLVGLAMVLLTLIGLAGMSASVVVAETAQGSASAINVAGSLRRLTHRIASLLAADALEAQGSSARVGDAVRMFDEQLNHPAMLRVLERTPDSLFAATYRGVEAAWRLSLRPLIEVVGGNDKPPTREGIAVLLTEVDAYVEQLNTLVAVLEHDTEARIQDLRQILSIAIGLTLVVVVLVLVLLQRALHRPLNDLLRSAQQIAGGNFAVPPAYTGRNELGQVGAAFNLMAAELSKLYGDLEGRVAAKTAELQRSNRALELLYHAIARLYQTPTSAAAYEATLRDIEQFIGLQGSLVCIEPRHDGSSTVIASTLGPCPDRASAMGAEAACAQCRAEVTRWTYQAEGDHDLLRVPLRDAERHYGMLRLELARGQRFEAWQQQLVEALSRHVGMALGAANRSAQERLLALQEERSVIARELHDSLAQALSYMKIQLSLLQPLIADPARAAEARATLADLREGVNAAYRQLRELLVSFRLKMTGGFPELLQSAVDEYAAKGKLDIALQTRLADCQLSPNQEVHVLHIIREALSNMVRHAGAGHAWLQLECDPAGVLKVLVDDDGAGLGELPANARHHHGLAIMRERARSLGGTIEFGARPGGGTRVCLQFPATAQTMPAATDRLGGLA